MPPISVVMQADGALQQNRCLYSSQRALHALEKQKWVPEVVMGSQNNQTGSAATDMMNLLMLKTAQDLNLDMKMKK